MGLLKSKKDLFRFTKTQAQGGESLREGEASAPGEIRPLTLGARA